MLNFCEILCSYSAVVCADSSTAGCYVVYNDKSRYYSSGLSFETIDEKKVNFTLAMKAKRGSGSIGLLFL